MTVPVIRMWSYTPYKFLTFFFNPAVCTVVEAVGVAVSFSAHDSPLGASGDLQSSSEYDDLEKERPEEVDMGVMKGTDLPQTQTQS